MAEQIASNFFLSINGVDLSDHVRSLTLNHGAELQDKTAMGDASRNRLPGTKDWSIDVEFNQDYDAAKVDATLFPLIGAAASAIIMRPDTAAVGATNPQYTGNALLESYSPVGGGKGDMHVTSITLQGDGDLARAVA